MKNFLLGALVFLGLSVLTATGLLQAGAIDVAADTPHSATVYSVIEWVRERSVARRAAAITPPADLSSAGRISRGAGNYAAMCADCHLAPGVEDSEIRKGLYPQPPNLANPTIGVDSVLTDARRFWIIKHGIKASGMPAWSRGGMEDDAIWDLAAFLKAMPSLSPAAYRRQVNASGGHAHGGIDAQSTEQAPTSATGHQHGAHEH